MYQWNLKFVTFPPALAAPPSIEDVNLRCVSADVPAAANSKITTEMRGHTVHQPGPNEYTGSISLTFTETVDGMIQDFISGWREICTQTNTGVHGAKTDVSAVIQLERLDIEDTPIHRYVMYGCFYENTDMGAMDNSKDTWKPVLTLSYDYFRDEAL
jgi:hypothetical protein